MLRISQLIISQTYQLRREECREEVDSLRKAELMALSQFPEQLETGNIKMLS
jgi:hypothetical protein